MEGMTSWVVDNWVPLVVGTFVAARILLLLATAIAKATVTTKDDEVVSGIQKIFDAIVGVLKVLALHFKTDALDPATEDIKKKVIKKGTGVTGILLLLSAAVVLAGCQAPVALREAQVIEVVALQGHLANDVRIQQIWENVYARTRDADIDNTTQMAIDLIMEKSQEAGVKPEVIGQMVTDLLANRDKAKGDTAKMQAKMRELVALNKDEVTKALQIHGKVSEWLKAGLTGDALQGAFDMVNALLQSTKKDKGVVEATPVPSAETPAPPAP